MKALALVCTFPSSSVEPATVEGLVARHGERLRAYAIEHVHAQAIPSGAAWSVSDVAVDAWLHAARRD